MNNTTILVVDDNRNILAAVRMVLENVFGKVICIASPSNIPARLREDKPDMVLLDMNFRSGINSGNEGLFWLHEIKRLKPDTQVVLFTAYANIDLAVRGIKEGAADFIVKPFENDRLIATLQEAYSKNHRPSPDRKTEGDGESAMYWGSSPAMTDLKMMVGKVAPTNANILITGENGTGKEVLAHEIHRLSRRNGHAMLPIDMGAITETLFESELFGHVKGAFTDAKSDKPGKFELAEGGTLFLDEIGNLSYALQAKLLTALQRRAIVRVGGSKTIPIDVRLICATNRDLAEMVRKGLFREDLLYRINTIHLHLPLLRERREDIAGLASLFLNRYAQIYNRGNMQIAEDAKTVLERMPWHGNIRELQHAMEKAVILCEENTIHVKDLEGQGMEYRGLQTGQPSMETGSLADMEQQMIEKTIRDCRGNLSQVAAQLDISRQTLYNKMKKYAIQ